jgi:hypothetical protein
MRIGSKLNGRTQPLRGTLLDFNFEVQRELGCMKSLQR